MIVLYLFLAGSTWIVLSSIRTRLKEGQSPYPLPPGPPADPIIGHVRHLPFTYQWVTFAKWRKLYGDLIYANALGKSLLIINSYKVASELMDKRGSNYADRPRLVLLNEMVGFGDVMSMCNHTDRFRKQRRMMQQSFNSRAVSSFNSQQRHCLLVFLNKLLDASTGAVATANGNGSTANLNGNGHANGNGNGHGHEEKTENIVQQKNLKQQIQRCFSAMMILITYGHYVVSDDDKYLNIVETATELVIDSGSPGSTPPDILPILQYYPTWLPGSAFKKRALVARDAVNKMLNLPFEMVRAQIEARTAKPSLTFNLMTDYQKLADDPMYVEDVKYVTGGLYSAGVETQSCFAYTLFLALIRYPAVMKRAQADIDRVVGSERLPEMSDRKNLPYLDCILKEVFRWNPPLPLIIPHCSRDEDVYEGMRIPGGSMLLANIWHMLRDPELHPDPEEFIPERYIKEEGKPEPYDVSGIVYGFGRRICPGRFFAEGSLWQLVAILLATLEVLPPLDENGKEYLPEAKFSNDLAAYPVDFECRIRPRTDKAERLLRVSRPLEEVE